MCLGVWLVLHTLCGIAYTGAGTILMVAGIFFFISSPLLQLGSNMLTGGLCIVFGVGSVILSCCGGREMNVSRLDKMLACTIIILVSCIVNLVVLELLEWYWLYNEDLIAIHHMETLAYYGHLVPSLTTCAVLAVAFLDAQFLYCTFSMRKTSRAIRQPHANETVSDIEYIIPRSKTRSISSKNSHSLTQYTQSWVFDSEQTAESPYLKLPPPSASTADMPKRPSSSPIISVQVEKEATDAMDRQLNHMRSFSRTHSPGAEGPSGPTLGPIYERLSLAGPQKSRLDTFVTDTNGVPRTRVARDDNQPYATLIAELGRSIVQKQERINQHRKESDAEFSRELEAALKLIQDLESPNTIETPSETFLPVPGALPTSGSTLSERSSLDGQGKKCRSDFPVESGYNSPANSERGERSAMGCIIRQAGPSAVVSIFPVDPVDVDQSSVITEASGSNSTTALTSKPKLEERGLKQALGKLRNLLSSPKPTLLPDLERAILKSESLAFLTDCELEARLTDTRNLHRRIEAKIHQEMFDRRSSMGSMENFEMSPRRK